MRRPAKRIQPLGSSNRGGVPRARTVAVICSVDDLRRARRLAAPPDFFELRLDALRPTLDRVEHALGQLRAPLIITARHPKEGALHALGSPERRRLLHRFLPCARYVDLETRSARFSRDVIAAARRSNVRLILSFHDLRGTPSLPSLRRKLEEAAQFGADIFKVATTVQTEEELERLLAFFDAAADVLPTAAMGMGRLGRKSRLVLARRGSALNYVYLTAPASRGQISLAEARRLLNRRTASERALDMA